MFFNGFIYCSFMFLRQQQMMLNDTSYLPDLSCPPAFLNLIFLRWQNEKRSKVSQDKNNKLSVLYQLVVGSLHMFFYPVT